MTLALTLGAILAVLAVLATARPFLRESLGSPANDRLDDLDEPGLALEEERDRTLAALKELEFDHRTGKVSDDDYRAMVAPLRRQAAALLSVGSTSQQEVSLPSEEMVDIPNTPLIPEPAPVPHEPPVQPHIPEPFPVPSTPPTPPSIPEPSPVPHEPPTPAA